MSRRQDGPVQVQSRAGQPHRFTWHGRAYVVAEVLGYWVNGAAWWQARGTGADDIAFWRVEARRAGTAHSGVYDLACNGQGWSLHRVVD